MKSLKKALLGIATVAISVVGAAQSASATTITVSGMEYANPTTATIQWPSHEENVYAGAFAASDGTKSFFAWCVDILQQTNFGVAVNDYTAGSAATFGQSKVDALGRLATESLNLVVDAKTSGAFQLAAWEIVNETGQSYSLTTGTFKADNVSNGSRDLAQTWLNNLPSASTYTVDLWISPTHQDLAVFEKSSGGSSTSVPEPTTVALLGLGLMGVAAARRKSAKTKNA